MYLSLSEIPSKEAFLLLAHVLPHYHNYMVHYVVDMTCSFLLGTEDGKREEMAQNLLHLHPLFFPLRFLLKINSRD